MLSLIAQQSKYACCEQQASEKLHWKQRVGNNYREIQSDRVLLEAWHPVASLKSSHHFGAVEIESKALRPYCDDNANAELQHEQQQNHNEVRGEQAAVVEQSRPVADERYRND